MRRRPNALSGESGDIHAAVTRADQAMSNLEQILNQADSVLGDGDTGGMLARIFSAMAEVRLLDAPDLGTGFGMLAKAALASTGSSLGTLFAVALMTFARETKGETSISWARLSVTLMASRDAMMARGGAKLGDKTVIDAVDAVAQACQGLTDPVLISRAATKAARGALKVFRGQPSKIGRARVFADASIGKDDAGMLAFTKLTEAVTQQRS